MMTFLDNLSSFEKVYLFCAIVGGAIFLLRAILMFIGMGGDDEGFDHFDTSDGDPTGDFKLVSVHSITAFFLMFGVVGFTVLRGNREAYSLAAALAIAAGAITMYIIAKMFQSAKKLESDGTIRLSDAVGAEGSVYLTIKPGEVGKVQIVVRDALKIFDARAKAAEETLKTGARVRVVESSDVVIVEKIN